VLFKSESSYAGRLNARSVNVKPKEAKEGKIAKGAQRKKKDEAGEDKRRWRRIPVLYAGEIGKVNSSRRCWWSMESREVGRRDDGGVVFGWADLGS
jgi:hypothetical protein